MRILTMAAVALASSVASGAVFADGHLQISDSKVELSVHMHHKRYTSYNEDWPVEQAACAITNVCLKNATIGSNTKNSGEAMNLLLASGKIPDIVGTSKIKDVVNQYGPQGAFMPLNDLIDEHAPHLKAYFDERPNVRSALTAADGNMYYIPYLPDGKYGRAFWMRTDWLDKLGLDVPQNVEEYEAALRAFRDGDPNGNGLKDEVPYFARQWEEVIRLVTLFGGRSSGSDTYHDFMVEDGQISIHTLKQATVMVLQA